MGEQPQDVVATPSVFSSLGNQQVVQENNAPVLRMSQRDRRPPNCIADCVTGEELDFVPDNLLADDQ